MSRPEVCGRTTRIPCSRRVLTPRLQSALRRDEESARAGDREFVLSALFLHYPTRPCEDPFYKVTLYFVFTGNSNVL